MALSDNILDVNKGGDGTPGEMIFAAAARVRERRLEQNLTQRALAARAGMSLASYRRFERTGDISFRKLVMIAVALDAEDAVSRLFAERRYASIDDVIAAAPGVTPRKRGRRGG